MFKNYQHQNYVATKTMTLIFKDRSTMVIQKGTSNIIGCSAIENQVHYHWGFNPNYLEIDKVVIDDDQPTELFFDQLQLNTLFNLIK
ncbi:MAG: hypothetical protein LBT77_01295 [Mycoplasmataceae bacterium]|jgi:hypothetical protein|nr:hypothetical protein [Mycoplasmataceae bacterium]